MRLCIPTLNRYDLCVKLLDSVEKNTVKPEEYVILDNGGTFKEYFKKSKLEIDNIRIVNFNKNLGVAGSWNWFLMEYAGDLLIANDDLIFSSIVIERFKEAKKNETDKNIIMYSIGNGSYELFMTDKSILMKVGKFDENFYPAYFEDGDYRYRMKLLGFKNKEVFKAGNKHIFHEVSGTMKMLDKEKHNRNFEKNKQYYIKKWGGEVHKEVYKTPFNIGENI